MSVCHLHCSGSEFQLFLREVSLVRQLEDGKEISRQECPTEVRLSSGITGALKPNKQLLIQKKQEPWWKQLGTFTQVWGCRKGLMILRATLLFILQRGTFTILFGKLPVWSCVISFPLYHWTLGSLSATLLVVNNVIHWNNGRRISMKARAMYQDALCSTCRGLSEHSSIFPAPILHNS